MIEKYKKIITDGFFKWIGYLTLMESSGLVQSAKTDPTIFCRSNASLLALR